MTSSIHDPLQRQEVYVCMDPMIITTQSNTCNRWVNHCQSGEGDAYADVAVLLEGVEW